MRDIQVNGSHHAGFSPVFGLVFAGKFALEDCDFYYLLGGYKDAQVYQVVTTLAKMGVPKSDIISFRPNLSKAKYGASELKSVIASDLPEEEKQHKVMEIMEQISNPKVSVDTFLENKKRRSFEASKGDLPIDGSVVVLPQGELIQIRSPKTSTTRAIQYQLKGIVDGWNQVDAVELATQLTDEVYTKDKDRPTILYGDMLIQGGEGIMMPTPHRFTELCWIQLGRTSRYLSEIMSLTPDGSASMTVFQIGIKCRTKEELEKHLKEQFRTNVLGITMSLEKAIRDFYEVPEAVQALFNRTDLQVWWRQGSALEVRLICMQSDGSEILNIYEDSGEREMQYSGQKE